MLAICTIDIRPLAPAPTPAPAGILKAASRQTRFADSSLGSAGAGPRHTQTHCRAWRKDPTPWVHRRPQLPPALILNSPPHVVLILRSRARLEAGAGVRVPALVDSLQAAPHPIGQRLIRPAPRVAVLHRAQEEAV